MRTKVVCEVKYDQTSSATLGGMVDVVRVICGDCGYEEQATGTSLRCIRSCLDNMAENCPRNAGNVYVSEDDEDEDDEGYSEDMFE